MAILYEPGGRAKEYSPLAANLYKGCQHGCLYCYVPSCPPWKFLDKPRQEFHRASVPRPNLLKQLELDCRRRAGDPREVLLCFTCDPYETGRDNSPTREALLILERHNMKVQVLTKGGMAAAADFDILARNPGWKFASTLSFISDEKRRKWEPRSASVEDRIASIKRAHEMGIVTWVSVEPVIDPAEALAVIRRLKGVVDFWKVGKVNHLETLEGKINWAQFLREVREALSGEQYLVKDDLLAYETREMAGTP